MEINELLKKIKEDDVNEINLQFSDIHGMIKSATVSRKELENIINEGKWFDGSSVEGFTRVYESDMYLKPDISTYSIIPWDKGAARIICDVCTPDDKPFQGDPRYALKQVIKEASDLGYEYNVSPELEFFLLNQEGNVHDNASYFDFPPTDLGSKVKKDIIEAIEKMDIEWEVHHHEVAPGQHEIDFKYGIALKTADRAITLKQIIKSIAQKHNLYATFMPKPFFGINGSGMHVHQSLFKDGENIFADLEDKYGLSKTAYSFIAGQLEHSKAITAIVAPTVNSYKRLVPGYEAPVYICWGQINRSALIRVPQYKKTKKQSARVELRNPDPSANPYLAFAVMLKAGLDGIKRELTPPASISEDVWHMDEKKLKEMRISLLPTSLFDALKHLEKDGVIKEALGKHLLERYIEAKTKEWDSYRVQVTEWEKNMYLKF